MHNLSKTRTTTQNTSSSSSSSLHYIVTFHHNSLTNTRPPPTHTQKKTIVCVHQQELRTHAIARLRPRNSRDEQERFAPRFSHRAEWPAHGAVVGIFLGCFTLLIRRMQPPRRPPRFNGSSIEIATRV